MTEGQPLGLMAHSSHDWPVRPIASTLMLTRAGEHQRTETQYQHRSLALNVIFSNCIVALFRANYQLIDWRLAPWTNSPVVKGRPEHKVVYVETQGPQKNKTCVLALVLN